MDTSYLSTQVNTIIGQLHGLFDEIGVPTHERESRESELFTALSETLHNQLRIVTAEKNGMTEEAYRIIKTVQLMERSLEDRKSHDDYPTEEGDLRVYAPLNRCLKDLKEKYNAIAKVHRERYEQVKKLVVALESYSSHLETSFVKIKLPPTANNATCPPDFDLSPTYVQALDDEFTRVYEEYSRRIATVAAVAEEIVNLWAELGTPQAQTDSTVVKHYRESPEQLGLHESDVANLTVKKDKLLDEKRNREKRVKDLRQMVEGLWDRLGVEELDRKRFLAGTRGCGLRVINEFESELDRLNELKRQNLHLFVEDARFKLQELWDNLYFSEEEMLDFTPAFSDVYSDALLSAHESEIARLEALKEQRLPLLSMIEKHRSLVNDREELNASSQDGSRLMLKPQKGERRDPGKLLREEKMRKRIAKELPKVTTELKKKLEGWEDEYGRPFLVHGARYLDDLAAAEARALPPRSKTPSSLPPAAKGKATPAASRQNSVMKPAPKQPAKTPNGTLRSRPPASVAATVPSKPTSPSKIPARVPLGTMKTGSNSPERRPPQSAPSYDSNTVRRMGPPARAPPPKMRDLFEPPPPKPGYGQDTENWRCESAASVDSGPIYAVQPDDVYDDRHDHSRPQPTYAEDRHQTPRSHHDVPHQQHASYASQTSHASQVSYTSQSSHGGHGGHSAYAQHSSRAPLSQPQYAESRVASTASSNMSQAVSGSENWETYSDTSEPEPDASDAYYAKLGAARGKRATPEGGYASPRQAKSQKLRSIYESGGKAQTFVEENGRMVPAGSDAGWTDEDAF